MASRGPRIEGHHAVHPFLRLVFSNLVADDTVGRCAADSAARQNETCNGADSSANRGVLLTRRQALQIVKASSSIASPVPIDELCIVSVPNLFVYLQENNSRLISRLNDTLAEGTWVQAHAILRLRISS